MMLMLFYYVLIATELGGQGIETRKVSSRKEIFLPTGKPNNLFVYNAGSWLEAQYRFINMGQEMKNHAPGKITIALNKITYKNKSQMKTSLQSDTKLSGYISLGRVLELLQDTEWHSIQEIQKEIALSSEKLNEVLHFLQEQALIDKKDEMLKITSTGLKFLQLKT